MNADVVPTTQTVRVRSAPGLQWRYPEGHFEARWRCRDDIVARPDFREFAIKSVKLWVGTGNPTLEDWDFIADTCTQLQQEMIEWANGKSVEDLTFDGTISSLIHCYRNDPDSNFVKKGKLRYASRVHYDVMLRMLDRELGAEVVANIKGRTVQRWHDDWTQTGKIATAHAKIAMLRILLGFGIALLEDPDCVRLAAVLSKMKFTNSKPRSVRLTAEQATMVRNKAHEMGRPSIAISQAFQFECMFRQKDCLGEWVPLKEPGASDVFDGDGMKWLRGIRWEAIDEHLVITHTTSKRDKEIRVNLRNAPMVMEELAAVAGVSPENVTRDILPASGPIVINEYDDLPWDATEFRRWWRKVANACGIDKNVRNMDSRAGAISEAIEAGARHEHVRHNATHSDIAMTQKYDRGADEAIALVQRLRFEKRNKIPKD